MNRAESIRVAERVERQAWSDMIRGAPETVRDALGLEVAFVDEVAVVSASRLPATFFNRAFGMERAIAATTLDAIERHYRERTIHRYWVQTTPLVADDALAQRGFIRPPRARWAKMLSEVASAPPGQFSSLEVRPANEEDVGALARIIVEAHGLPPPFVPWIGVLARRAGWTLFGAWDADVPVAGGFLFAGTDGGWLGMGGTASEHRGKGAHGALLRARLALTRVLGLQFAASETGEPIGDEHNPSLANMRRVGMTQVCSRTNYQRDL